MKVNKRLYIPQVIIRQFSINDFPEVRALELDAFNEDNSMYYIELYQFFPDSFYVATVNNKVVGFVVGLIVERVGRIFSLAVLRDYRGSGIGKALLEKIIDVLEKKEVKKIRLEVRENNEVAKRLYKSMNFKEVGIIPYYYKDGGSAIVMEREGLSWKNYSRNL
ncbi:ribosomal protein S18-alanine N-acetyltransferase [Candidatus Methanoliparum sp. LAM-1]|uniref:ribosomal protein S18-alanine N-acetyltransferase n=1 Tax=Candidatus Methanoliparum sp. LAM-1 TaxID=2874846 RepID=UPI001E59CEB4|nr:ribosomal protein S18-alanine N-acetyltransferase [Candidatus Methanoliparum sp. LAM-1]BDC35482.1 ribosomal-protein-alanine N-acetyltransferase RimI [Candidatus Methanoliparum sp. LAM-1]